MSDPPMAEETESRQVLAPAGNKGRSVEQRKSSSLSKPKSELLLDNKQPQKTGGTKGKNAPSSLEVTNPPPQSNNVPSILRRKMGLKLNVSLNASCSSDASSDSSRSRPSTGKSSRRNVKLTHIQSQRNQCGSKSDKVVNNNGTADSLQLDSPEKKRCAWVTPTTGMLVFSLQSLANLCSFDSKLLLLLLL